MKKRRILVFGCSKAGKTSMLNTITGQEMEVSDAAVGTTLDTQRYEQFIYNGKSYQFIDTAGLDEGTVSNEDVIKNVIKFVENEAEGFNLFVMVIAKSVISRTVEKNYELFIKHIKTKEIPTLCVVTRCENDDPLNKWVVENKWNFENRYGIKFNNMIGSCFAQEWTGRFGETYKELCEESKEKVMDMIEKTCSETPHTIIQEGMLETFKRIMKAIFGDVKTDEFIMNLGQALFPGSGHSLYK
uniref:G domain-containing protein n=1 Tax=Panagrolaimus sp. JU765 TaxID=591449 RepID=A0AC34QGD5_9BILA